MELESPTKTIVKENAIAMEVLDIIQVACVFVGIAWYAPAIASTAGARFTYLFNYHVAFLIGNALIMLVIMLSCMKHGGDGGGGDLYDDYARHREINRALPPPEQEEAMPAEFGDCDKQIVAVAEDESSQCDDVARLIEKAERKMRKLRKIRSEMENHHKTVSSDTQMKKLDTNRSEMAPETENHRETIDTNRSEMENHRETLCSERQMRKLDRNRSEIAPRCEVTVPPETEDRRETMCLERQMRKLHRNRSEIAVCEYTVRPELQKSETESDRETFCSERQMRKLQRNRSEMAPNRKSEEVKARPELWKSERQMRMLQRNQSENHWATTVCLDRQMRRNRSEMSLRRDVTVRTELRGSERGNHWETVCTERQMRMLQRNMAPETEYHRETVISERQMGMLQRNGSGMAMRRDVTVRLDFGRSENRRETVTSEIDRLNSEEFKRRVDAFIDRHWVRTTSN